jgi:hypothetical protein
LEKKKESREYPLVTENNQKPNLYAREVGGDSFYGLTSGLLCLAPVRSPLLIGVISELW